MERAKTMYEQKIGGDTHQFAVHFIIGVKPHLHESGERGRSYWSTQGTGFPVYDADFDLSPEENQEWLYNFCVNLERTKFAANSTKSPLYCPIIQLKHYGIKNDLPFPIPRNLFNQTVAKFHINEFGFQDNTTLRMVRISLQVPDIKFSALDRRIEVYEHFENIVKEAKKSSPKGLREMWQVPYDQWAKVEMARSLNQNVYNGISISMVITFMFLLASTGNLILSSLAILSISLVVVSLFATIRLAGWGMGVPESIGVVVFVGFAIDYVVHICHQYQQSPF